MPQGEATEILNEQLAGAKNVLGTLRWLKSGEKYKPDPSDKHQLLYLMEGKGSIHLENKDHEVSKGMGVYLGPVGNRDHPGSRWRPAEDLSPGGSADPEVTWHRPSA